MYTLKEKTKAMISYILGMDCEQFAEFSYEEEMEYIKSATGSMCEFVPETDERIIGRGNPLLARNEFLTMEEINRKLDGETRE